MDNLGNAIERSVIFKLGEAELSKLRMQAVIHQQQQEINALKAVIAAKDAEIIAIQADAIEPELPINCAHINGSKH